MLRLLWRASRGYRWNPWRSPYLRWRLETYLGVPADSIGFGRFWKLVWTNRRDILRYLRWTDEMQARALQR